jgi:ABC-2 type transport system permease protein
MEALNFAKEYPTRAALDLLVKSMGSNPGLDAIFGPSPRIDTVGGYMAARDIGVLGIIGAIWGLLVGTRLLRGEEDAGRWELLLAGATTRRRTAAAAMAGLGVAWFALWSVTAAATLTAATSGYSVTRWPATRPFSPARTRPRRPGSSSTRS